MPRIPTDEEAVRIREAVNWVERHRRNALQQPVKRVRVSAGTAKNCSETHRFWTNGPNGGTFSVTYTILEASHAVTWDYNATSTDVRDAFVTAFTAEGLENDDLDVVGGDWPFVAIYVTFNARLGVIPFPVVNNTSLTNGSGFMDKYSTSE